MGAPVRKIEQSNELTVRECEVAALIAQGESNRFIASTLGISEETVKVHLKNVFEKRGFDNRVQVAVWWASLGADAMLHTDRAALYDELEQLQKRVGKLLERVEAIALLSKDPERG